jgi:hypothetical protein
MVIQFGTTKKIGWVRVLYGTAPDAGAYKFLQANLQAKQPTTPTNLRNINIALVRQISLYITTPNALVNSLTLA